MYLGTKPTKIQYTNCIKSIRNILRSVLIRYSIHIKKKKMFTNQS